MSDDDFLPGVYRLSAWLWAAVSVLLVALAGWRAAAGWTTGAVLSAGVVRSLEIFVRRGFVPGNPNARRGLTRASAAKLPVLVLILTGVVLLGGNSAAFVASFCGGVLLVQGAIVLKTAGMLASEQLRSRKKE